MKAYQICPHCEGSGECYDGWPTDPTAYAGDCEACGGTGSRPRHPNTANGTSAYALRKRERRERRRSANAVALAFSRERK